MTRNCCLLAAALAAALAVLAACSNPAAPANHPPTASFPAPGYLVSGTLIPDATGTYTPDGIFNGFIKYKQESGSFFLFRFTANDDTLLHWGLDLSAATPLSLANVAYYAAATVAPDSGWGAWAAGTGGGAALVQKLPISGKTEFGNELAPHYTFQDADGDLEGTSTFSWYRFDTSTDTTLGAPIATTRNYTTVLADDGKYLRVRVTPVDALGAAGTPALSPPVRIGTNNPPEVGFPTWDFEVQGAGTAAFNGGYLLQAGTKNGYPWYAHESGPYFLFNFTALDDGFRHWGLHTDTTEGFRNFNQVTYYSGTSLAPPPTGWTTAIGAGTAPTVTSSPFSGSTDIGGTLTAEYVFTDPDGDAEGATTFQWYRFDDSTSTTGGTPIGTSSASYTTVGADDTKWLRVEVTPVDEWGAVGTPVLSDPIKVGSS